MTKAGEDSSLETFSWQFTAQFPCLVVPSLPMSKHWIAPWPILGLLFTVYFCSLGELIQSQGFKLSMFQGLPNFSPALTTALNCQSVYPAVHLASPLGCLVGNWDWIYIKHNHSFLCPSQTHSFWNLHSPTRCHHHVFNCWNLNLVSHSWLLPFACHPLPSHQLVQLAKYSNYITQPLPLLPISVVSRLAQVTVLSAWLAALVSSLVSCLHSCFTSVHSL